MSKEICYVNIGRRTRLTRGILGAMLLAAGIVGAVMLAASDAPRLVRLALAGFFVPGVQTLLQAREAT
jgi:hypothetical protein